MLLELSIYSAQHLKNPTQFTELKKVEHSSQKWSPKFASSMASLHTYGSIFTIYSSFFVFELPKILGLYRIFGWESYPNFLPRSGLKSSSRSPKDGKNPPKSA
jgi:hypothetical protein